MPSAYQHVVGWAIPPPGSAVRLVVDVHLEGSSTRRRQPAALFLPDTMVTCYEYDPFSYTMRARESWRSCRDGAPRAVGSQDHATKGSSVGDYGDDEIRGERGHTALDGSGRSAGTVTGLHKDPIFSSSVGSVALSRAPRRCRCHLVLSQLFSDVSVDYPSPSPNLSRCELHEILRALPHRFQNYPWRLCYNTAQDGFSLRNFYRRMEAVYEEGSAGIGILLVRHGEGNSSREDEALGRGDGKTGTPASVRDRASDVGIIGCFTPQVPCLESHGGSQRTSYGAEETFVFRINLAGRRAQYHEDSLSHQLPVAARGGSSERRQGRSVGGDGCSSSCRGGGVSTTALPPSLRTQATATGSSPQIFGQQFFIDAAANALVLPTATRHAVIGASLQPHGSAGKPVGAVGLDDDSHDGAASSIVEDVATILKSPSSAPDSLPQAEIDVVGAGGPPILVKYPWAGDVTNRQFVTAHTQFFAIGGGKDGAALYVDDTLQHATSSTHCQTFDSPALFGRRPAAGMRHTEMVVSQMIWFSVKEGPRAAFRIMTDHRGGGGSAKHGGEEGDDRVGERGLRSEGDTHTPAEASTLCSERETSVNLGGASACHVSPGSAPPRGDDHDNAAASLTWPLCPCGRSSDCVHNISAGADDDEDSDYPPFHQCLGGFLA